MDKDTRDAEEATGQKREQAIGNEFLPQPKKQYVSRSLIWNHCTKTEGKVTCNYCHTFLKYDPKSGTSVLWNHNKICKVYKAFVESKDQKVLVRSNEDGQIVAKGFNGPACRKALGKMIVLDELPFVFVEGVGFRHFCETAIPLFEIPSWSTITRDIVEMYQEEKTLLKSLFSKNKQRLCLTTDIWTAPTTSVSYMVITSHFIDENWSLQRKIISFRPVPDHRGETIADRIKSSMIEWGIEKIFTITLDNASANNNAIKHLTSRLSGWRDDALVLGDEFMHVRCCAHILNLIVKDGLESISGSIAAIRNAVKYVRSSDNRFRSFQMRVGTNQNVTRGSLVLDCTTRWNSTYLMLVAALKFRSAFELLANEDIPYSTHFLEEENGNKKEGPPSDVDWDKASRLEQSLEIFFESTLAFSAFKTMTATSCYDEICNIEASLVELNTHPDFEVRSMSSPMLDKFRKYWDGLDNINPILIAASVFDPRNKMAFATLCFEKMYGKNSARFLKMKEKVMSLLERLYKAYKTSHKNNMCETDSERTDGLDANMKPSGSKGIHRRSTIFSTIYHQMQSQNQCVEESSNELSIYLIEKVEVETSNSLGLKYDILSWWRVNSLKFSVLSKVARDILVIPVSSVASESAFSTGGRILDPYRSCLTPYMVEALILTQNWIKTVFLSNAHTSIEQILREHEYMGSLEEELIRQSDQV